MSHCWKINFTAQHEKKDRGWTHMKQNNVTNPIKPNTRLAMITALIAR